MDKKYKELKVDNDKGFFMLFTKGGSNPTRIHPTLAIAYTEAQRITEKNGHPVWILQAIGGVKIKKSEVEETLTNKGK